MILSSLFPDLYSGLGRSVVASSAQAPSDERRSWYEMHSLVGERPLKVAVGDAGVLAHDRLSPGPLAPLDGGQHAAVLVLRNCEQAAVATGR
jgi:hypothetical protein